VSGNPKVLIQIALLEDNQIGINSTSSNQVTNLGLLQVADSFFKSVLANSQAQKSNIVIPDAIIQRNGK
jgi:hypothetical protein